MVLPEDLDCSVCFQQYSRSMRVPRMLYCRHTFCAPCLEKLAQQHSDMQTVRCPLCRRVSCMSHGLAIQEALWINNKVWVRISESEETEETEQALAPMEDKCRPRPNTKHTRPRLQLPSFLQKLTFARQPQDRIAPASNVHVKSWRIL